MKEKKAKIKFIFENFKTKDMYAGIYEATYT